jgi:hypothetical protein
MIISVCLLTQCIDEQVEKKATETPAVTNSLFAQFAGSASCAGCHKDIYEKHLHTAHFLTSGPATDEYIRGTFQPDSNSFRFSPTVEVRMEKRENGFFQVAYLNGQEKRAERFDISVGSGTKGQSFLHWSNKELTQLPLTWFSAYHQWANSPGYRGMLMFNRSISARCLECHTTYAHKLTPENQERELFDEKEIIFGVDCEKCHGPAAQHVAFYQQHPTDTTGKFIVNPAKLTRRQKLDLCALCHGGRFNKTKPSFTFTAGDKLTDYFHIDTACRSAMNMDVHGNQYGMMASSKCFNNSEMTCNSCHNPHENEKGKLQLFSQRCRNCHQPGHAKLCKLTATQGKLINNDCIDCHMPKKPSHSIMLMLQGNHDPTPALMRTHLITIYPEETEKVLAFIKSTKKS